MFAQELEFGGDGAGFLEVDAGGADERVQFIGVSDDRGVDEVGVDVARVREDVGYPVLAVQVEIGADGAVVIIEIDEQYGCVGGELEFVGQVYGQCRGAASSAGGKDGDSRSVAAIAVAYGRKEPLQNIAELGF